MRQLEKVQAAIKLMGNPYASLSFFPDEEEITLEQKRSYFKKLEDPHAFNEIFSEADDDLWQAAERRKKNEVFIGLEQTFDEVLGLYKNYVARNEWGQLMDFRPVFLKQAGETDEQARLVTSRLQKFKFSLNSDEKVEFNRAKAVQIINGLKKILI